MSNFMLGKKLGMTQIFTEGGVAVPVTVIQAGPLSVVQKKVIEKDGYSALKVGYFDVPKRKVNRPAKGEFEKANISPKKYMKEFRVEDVSMYEVGQEIKVEEMFSDGDSVDISGVSKGKGFQGTVKRHGTSRGRMTHGSHYHRGVGSMGGASDPSRVPKGKKLPGHMGLKKVTVQNLKVVKVDSKRGLLLVKGAVPGAKGGLLVIKSSVKA